MQASLLNVFVRLSQKALDQSREHGASPSSLAEAEDCGLSDGAFAKLLQEIDSFSGELAGRSSKERIPEKPIPLPSDTSA